MATSKNFELGSFANNVDHDPSTGDTQISNNITLTGELRGPSTFIIDPAGIGDNTGLLQIKGNLQVDGTTTTINSTTLDVDDLNITIAKGAGNPGAANGAGITVDGANATFTYDSANDRWTMNKPLFATIEGMSINDLTDVDTNTTPPTNGQTIVWNTTTGKFEPGDSFSQSDFNTAFGAKNVGDLNDVDTTGVTNGQVLVYNATTNIFEPGTVSGGGGGGSGLFSLLDF
tara:strand:+ start:635 stop:1324 length:690 start_codon:yes stop_codon:yes gene_type:complete